MKSPHLCGNTTAALKGQINPPQRSGRSGLTNHLHPAQVLTPGQVLDQLLHPSAQVDELQDTHIKTKKQGDLDRMSRGQRPACRQEDVLKRPPVCPQFQTSTPRTADQTVYTEAGKWTSQ